MVNGENTNLRMIMYNTVLFYVGDAPDQSKSFSKKQLIKIKEQFVVSITTAKLNQLKVASTYQQNKSKICCE